MAFEVGNKLGGRKKGSENKATATVRDAFTLLVENNLERLSKDIDSLDPKDRIKYIIDLAQFILPKLKTVEAFNHSFQEQPLFLSEEESKTLLSLSDEKFNTFYDDKRD